MGNEYSKELNLAAELRSACDKHGKENDIKKSAAIFYEFGLLYRNKSPDKISLIRSAVFFNAALIREPHNARAMQDLKELCEHVLNLAGADKQDLIKLSLKTKTEVDEMRKETESKLTKLKLIPVGLPTPHLEQLKAQKIAIIRNLQTNVTDSFVCIMNNVSKECIKLMGTPPCLYAVVGMGSLARKEVTPYSDFEHVIILEEGVQSKPNYQDILKYFRWFTVIFQIIIINLKETIIPSVAIPLLNNPNISGGDWFFDCHTRRGISFDGMMLHACKFPLGRFRKTASKPFTTELIKPVSEMAKYLQSDEDIRNGYHLADILTRTSFISGHESVYDQFERLVQQVLDCNFETNVFEILSQLHQDLNTYDAAKSIDSLGVVVNWNVKRVIYRSATLFVSAAGRLNLIKKCSCFEIVDELLIQRKIRKEVSEKLCFAIAVACETRLKAYMSKFGQDDLVGCRRFNIQDNNIVRQICELIGEQSFGEYYITALMFQLIMRSSAFYYDAIVDVDPIIKFQIFSYLDLHELVLAEWQRYAQDKDFSVNVLVCYYVAWTNMRIGRFENALEIYNKIEKSFAAFPDIDRKMFIRRKANCLCETGRHEEGLVYIKRHMSMFESPTNCIDYHAMGYLLALQGDCERHIGHLDNAVNSYNLALTNVNFSKSYYKNNLQAKCFYFLAACEAALEKPAEALENAKKALLICNGSHIEISLECKCCRLVGDCYMRLMQPQVALQYFEKELTLFADQKDRKPELSCCDLSPLRVRIQHATAQIQSTAQLGEAKELQPPSAKPLQNFNLHIRAFKDVLNLNSK